MNRDTLLSPKWASYAEQYGLPADVLAALQLFPQERQDRLAFSLQDGRLQLGFMYQEQLYLPAEPEQVEALDLLQEFLTSGATNNLRWRAAAVSMGWRP